MVAVMLWSHRCQRNRPFPSQGLRGQASHCAAMVPPYGGRSHSVHSSISAEELTDHRMHFHGLFLLDLLIGPENDTNSQ